MLNAEWRKVIYRRSPAWSSGADVLAPLGLFARQTLPSHSLTHTHTSTFSCAAFSPWKRHLPVAHRTETIHTEYVVFVLELRLHILHTAVMYSIVAYMPCNAHYGHL